MGWQPDGPTRSAASGARSERLRRAKVRASALPVANPATGMAWCGVPRPSPQAGDRVLRSEHGYRVRVRMKAPIPGAGSDEAPPRPRSVIEPGRRRPRAPTARGHRFFPPRRSGPGWRQAPARTVRWRVSRADPPGPPPLSPAAGGHGAFTPHRSVLGPHPSRMPGPTASRRGVAIHPVGPLVPPQGCRGKWSRIDNSVQPLVARPRCGDAHSIGWRFGKDVAGAPGDRYSGAVRTKIRTVRRRRTRGRRRRAGPRARTCTSTLSGKPASGRRRRPEGRTRWRSR